LSANKNKQIQISITIGKTWETLIDLSFPPKHKYNALIKKDFLFF